MEITLEEAAHGKESQIRIPTWDNCETCHGSGAKPGTSPKVCSTCNGSGQVTMRQGFFSIQQTCPHCRGTGKIIPEPCTTCHGQGKVKKNKTLEVKIPAGINEGMRIRSAGNGEPGTNGGPPGDLYIEIRIKAHEIFERDGDDLHCSVPVALTTVALGGNIEVPTLSGKAEIELPEGTQHGKTFRLRGKGIKGVRSSYPGDLYCHISVETPVKLTEHQRKLLKELDESFRKGGDKHSPTSKSLVGPGQGPVQVAASAAPAAARLRRRRGCRRPAGALSSEPCDRQRRTGAAAAAADAERARRPSGRRNRRQVERRCARCSSPSVRRPCRSAGAAGRPRRRCRACALPKRGVVVACRHAFRAPAPSRAQRAREMLVEPLLEQRVDLPRQAQHDA